MTPRRRTTTPDERAKAAAEHDKKLEALHQRLTDEVKNLRSGDDWQHWLNVASRFHQYSFSNVMLIRSQRPDASAVAGYEAWRGMGRQVSNGEKGIAVLAPIVRRPMDEDRQREDGETAPRVVGFRATYVWDVTQTTGEPLPCS